MEKIAFITDAGCDINEEFAEEHGIYVIPFSIIFKDGTYLDRIDISREEVYKRMETEIPTTSIVPTEFILNMFHDIENKGIKNVVIMTMSSKMSGLYNLLRMLIEQFPNLNIELIDSESISIGGGLPLIKGVFAYEDGADFETVVQIVKDAKKDVFIYAYFRDITNLMKGGRVPRGKVYVANALNIKPMMAMKDGEMVEAKKIRGDKKAIQFFRDEFDKYAGDKYYISPMYASNLEGALKLDEEFAEEIKKATYYTKTVVTPTIGVHSGTDFTAFAFMRL